MAVSTLPRTPSLQQVLDHALRLKLANVHTSMPGRVDRFDSAKQVVDVTPLLLAAPLELEDGSVVLEPLPQLPNVPVYFLGGGGFRVTLPVQPGDTCWLVFAESSIDQWQAQGGQRPPGLAHRFNLSDAIAFVGAHDDKNPWTGCAADAMTAGKDGGPQVLYTASDIQLGATDSLRAVDQALLGTTYRAAEDAMLTGISTQLAAISASLTALGVSLTALFGTLTPPVLPSDPNLATVLSSITAIVTSLGLVDSLAIAPFQAAAAAYLSTLVKLR